jgi:hypothetical protein
MPYSQQTFRTEPCVLPSCLACSSTEMKKVLCFPEASIDFQRTTWRYISENWTLHSHRWQKFRYNSSYLGCSLLLMYNINTKLSLNHLHAVFSNILNVVPFQFFWCGSRV